MMLKLHKRLLNLNHQENHMNVIAFYGSPRKNGNTYSLVRRCLNKIESEGIATELIHVSADDIKPCRGCNYCRKAGVERCAITDDKLNEWFEKICQADGIIFGSPTYLWGPRPAIKSLIDRACYLARGTLRAGGNQCVLKNKVGAAIAVDAYTGNVQTVQAMQVMFMVTQMIVPGASYWPVGKGLNPGDVEKDSLAMSYMDDLGNQMAWLIKQLKK